MTIELYNKSTGEMQTVECWKTATPHFVVTKPIVSDPNVDVSEFFNVTHARSTALALGPFTDKRLASLCAAILGYLPMPWDDFSMAVSQQFKTPDPEQEKRFSAAWAAIPEEIKKWRKEMADWCLYSALDDEEA